MNKYVTAHVVDAYGSKMALVKIPVLEGDIPDVPRLIEKNGWYAYLKNTNPLTYSWIEKPISVEVIESFSGEFK